MALLLAAQRAASKRLVPTTQGALYQCESLRCFAAEPAKAAEDDDIVLASFRKQQKQYQTLVQNLEKIPLPLTGDDAAIKKYAQEVEALKKKIGMPDFEDLINAELDYKFACSGYDVKSFVASAMEDMNATEATEPILKEIMAAVEEAEKSSGKPLDGNNDKGWATLTAKVQEIEKKYGMADKAKVRDESVFEAYKKHISDLRTAVQEDVGKVQAAEQLEYIKPNLDKLKPKLT